MKLNLELVPSTCFYKNVRQILTKLQWSVISNQIRTNAYNICEICQVNSKESLDCHEVWDYDDAKQIQKLIRLIALCKKCHGVIHFGYSQIRGLGEIALKHFMKINKLKREDAEQYIQEAFAIWVERSKVEWKLDISLLKEYGIDIKKIIDKC